VGDFVQGRVNPAIQSSPHVASLVRPTGSTRDPDKVGLRRIGRGYTYWRTARSRSGLKSVPVDILILDEYDEMPLGTYSLAEKRLGSSTDPQIILISTPTYPGSGIEPEYLLGTQYEYFITCSYCGTEQALEWEKNVDLDRNMRVCVACRESIEDDIWAAWNMYEGRWIAKNPQGLFPSYHLSQLYRSDLDLVSIAVDLDSSDISKRQEAVNQNLGLPFAPPGNQLSLEELRRAALVTVSIHNLSGRPGCWLGVDIGSRLHCVITHDDIQGELSDRPARVLVGAFEVDNFADLDFVMRRYSVNMAVLDAHPELHSAHEFAMKYQGAVYLCNYQMGQMPPAFWAKEGIDAKRWYKVNVDRTAAIDVTFGAIRDTVIRFPYDAETVPGLFAHLMAPVRTLTPDKDGNPRATYVEGAKADHYAHAMVYSELAAYIARATPRQGVLRVREMSALPDYEGDPLYVPVF
jgi:hypothetical protein